MVALYRSTEKPLKGYWFHAGSWWAIGVSGGATGSWYVHKWDGADWAIASPALVTTANAATVDAHLRDGKVTWYGWHSSAPRTGRVVYNAGTGQWDVDVAAVAVPVLPSVSNKFASGHLVVDSLGRTWCFADDTGAIRYFVRGPNSLSAVQGNTVLTTDPPTSEHLSRSVAWDGKVGILWDDQANSRMRFMWRNDSDPVTAWQAIETVSSGLVAENADDHGDIVPGPNGELLACWKTGMSGSSDPNIMYARRTADGLWVDETAAFTRFGSVNSDEYTRPRIAYDETNDEVYVFATRTFRPGQVHYRKARRIGAEFGEDIALIASPMEDISTPRHAVDANSGLMILTHDGDFQVVVGEVALDPGRVIYWADTVEEADAFPDGAVVWVATDTMNPPRFRRFGGWWGTDMALQDGFEVRVDSLGTPPIFADGALQAAQAGVTGATNRQISAEVALSAQPAASRSVGTRRVVGAGAVAAGPADTQAAGLVLTTVLANFAADPAGLTVVAEVRRVAAPVELRAAPANTDNTGTKKTTATGALRAGRAAADINAGKKYTGTGVLVAGDTRGEGYGIRRVRVGDVSLAADQATTAGVGSPKIAGMGWLMAGDAAFTADAVVPIRVFGAMVAGAAGFEVTALRGQFFDVAIAAGDAQTHAQGTRTLNVTAALKAGPPNTTIFVWTEQSPTPGEWIVQF